MSIEWMKKKYRLGGKSYKLQKSSSGNSGKSNKKSNKRAKPQKDLVGKKVLLVNMSGVDKFCPVTGKKLPTHGMVVEHGGTYYADYEASARAN
jgi:hypothetical protein